MLQLLLMMCSLVGGDYAQDLAVAKEAAEAAGQQILEVRASEDLDKREVTEIGKTFVRTKADVAANAVIVEKLRKAFPNYAIVSQEASDQAGSWWEKEYVWVVNPLDGTVDFASGGNEFAVQIGLLYKGEPVLGVNYFPASKASYWAVKGQGAWQDGKRLQAQPTKEIVLLKSSGLDKMKALFERMAVKQTIEVGSSSGRIIAIAEGKATLYVSLGALPQGGNKGAIWNYAASSVIAKEAGVTITTLKGKPINFLEKSMLLPDGVVVTTNPEAYKQVVNYFRDGSQ